MWWYSSRADCNRRHSPVWLLFAWRNILTVLAGTIFLALSGIKFFNPLNSPYLKDVLAEASFIFPNTLSTITEIQTASFTQILINATGSVEMGLVCLTGLALFLYRHPVIAIAYGPLVAFGLLNFVIGNRAIFYSAPIMWFGAAFLMTTTATSSLPACPRVESTPAPGRQHTRRFRSDHRAWVNSPTDYVPRQLPGLFWKVWHPKIDSRPR